MRILGIKVWPDRSTDEQYIEMIRKGLRVHRWLRYFFAALAIFMIIILCSIMKPLYIILTGTLTPHSPQITFIVALASGFSFGLMIHALSRYVGMVFFELRKDHMLVECWDKMKQLQQDLEITQRILEEIQNKTSGNAPSAE